ncbi:MAG: transglutaminase family protein [Pseudomonadota bacterium]
MSIQVALNHRTTYRYDRLVGHAPHTVRLRPAPHTRTKIVSYSQRITPTSAFVNWQQDPFANYQARLVFPELADKFEVEIDLIADLESINPFDFFLDEAARDPAFRYDADTRADLAPYLVKPDLTPRLAAFIADRPKAGDSTIDYMVALNQYVFEAVGYIVRMEPGVQTPEETLVRAKGSCRDSAWLLVHMLRDLGFAARFVSGYLIQLTPDIKSVDGPSGPKEDFTDLHAWTEVYLPGAGWVGLDPTSGLFASEGHIPLAATPNPRTAAPITGAVDPCEVEFEFAMSVTRVGEPPRQTKPLTDAQWSAIQTTGAAIDKRLDRQKVGLTVGGEPTFIAASDRDADEWTVDAVGPTKRRYADKLVRRLRDRFAPGGALHYGQGKWYPGEQLPRWAFELRWRGDGLPMWQNADLIATEGTGGADVETAERFMNTLCDRLDIPREHAAPAFEDPVEFSLREANLPEGATPDQVDMADPMLRHRLVETLARGIEKPKSFVLPLQQAQTAAPVARWMSEIWQTRRGKIFLIPGDSPAGLRLPLEALPLLPEGAVAMQFDQDTMQAARPPLPERFAAPTRFQAALAERDPEAADTAAEAPDLPQSSVAPTGGGVRTALTVEPRFGTLCVFLPPVYSAEGYIALLNAVEDTAEALGQPVHVEGYAPPPDPRLNVIKVTPDPGVIEVNIHPAKSFADQSAITEALYEEARAIGLDASSFLVDGRVTGSGGGNHVVMGGASPAESPFLRRPDLLASIIRYWQNHPSLSYLFSGLFVGPTSQAPRIDEARHDALYQLELALAQLPSPPDAPPWLVDRMFRNLLIDVTGNTHRAEICIDKLYSPDGPTGRLGLVEFRGFEMPPHPRMAVAQNLVLRALIAMFWEKPYQGDLIRWGTGLQDRFMLPHFVWEDFRSVLGELSAHFKMPFEPAWFQAQLAFRFPLAGEAEVAGAKMELRNAIEPWPTLGEQGMVGGTTRFVDSSCERLELRIRDLPEGLVPTVNGVEIPLTATEYGHVAGIRFRAWHPAHCLHPQVLPHAPLTFDLVDPAHGRSVGGFTYRVSHEGGRAHEDRPINDLEAEGRRISRFDLSHTPGPVARRVLPPHPEFPVTLDLMRL